MKNKLIYLLCLVLSVVMAFASCDEAEGGEGGNASNGGSQSHSHTYSENWSSDAKNHWHAATCEHGENKDALAEHSDANEDGKCDVCVFEVGHTHSYSSEWASDDTKHWQVATCSHADQRKNEGLHLDENTDAKCDVCDAHVHVLTTSGMCIGCFEQFKEIDTSSISAVIGAVADRYSSINGGKIVSNFIGRYNNSAHSTKSNKVIDYIYGTNSAYYKIANATEIKSTDREGVEYEASTSDVVEKWMIKENESDIFAVYKETVAGVAGELQIDSVNANTLNGYYYSVSTLCSGYGAEGILKALYEKSQEKGASEFYFENEEGVNAYEFGFNYLAIKATNTSDGQGNSLGLVVNVNYFVVTVNFAYTDNYSLTNLSIKCDCYTSDAGSNIQGDLDMDNIDLEYATQTGKIELLPDAKADTYTFSVEQTVGERTFENDYTKDYFTPAGYDVYADRDATVLCPDTVTISLTNLPEYEYYPYVRFRIMSTEEGKIFTDADSITFTSSDDSGLSFKVFDPIRVMGSFLAKTVGTYTVTIDVNGVVKTFTVIVTE